MAFRDYIPGMSGKKHDPSAEKKAAEEAALERAMEEGVAEYRKEHPKVEGAAMKGKKVEDNFSVQPHAKSTEDYVNHTATVVPLKTQSHMPPVITVNSQQDASVEKSETRKPIVISGEEAPKNPDAPIKDGEGVKARSEEIPSAAVVVSPDVEKFSELYRAVSDNNQRLTTLIDETLKLAIKVDEFDQHTFRSIAEQSATIQSQKETIQAYEQQSQLSTQANQQLLLEKQELANLVQSWSTEKQQLESLVADYKQKLEDVATQMALKDQTITKLSEQIATDSENHKSEIIKLNDDHAAELKRRDEVHAQQVREKDEMYQAKISTVKEDSDKRVEDTVARYNDVFPQGICDLFGYRLGDKNDSQNKLVALYSYLGLLRGNLRPTAFTKRFQTFDSALFDALENDSEALESCRDRIEPHLNEFARNNGCPICVEWPKTGSQFNADTCFAEGSSGVKVQRTLRAVIYTVDARGGKKCTTKGRVETL